MKKILAAILASVTLTASLTGCGGASSAPVSDNDASAGSSSESSAAGEQITLKIMAENTVKQTSDMFKARMAQFEESHPGVTIEIEELPFADFPKKVNLAFAGGMAPDIICGAISNIANGVERGQYEPMDSYIESWEGKDNIIDNLYEMGSYKDGIYGLPYKLSPQLLVYRKDYFEEAGLDPETPPCTWDALLDAAQKTMVEENGRITRSGFSVSVDGTFNPIMFARTNGADLFNEETGEYTVNTPEFIEAVEYVAQLQKTSMAVNAQLEDSQHPMTTGNAAISLISSDKLSQWLTDVPEMADKIGFIIPENTQGSMWVGANYYHISAESQHKDLAWEFIQMCFTEENIKQNYTEYGLTNVLKSLEEDYRAQNPLLAAAIGDAVAVGKGASKVTNFNLGSAQTLVPAMQSVYYGEKDAQQAMEDARKQFDQAAQAG